MAYALLDVGAIGEVVAARARTVVVDLLAMVGKVEYDGIAVAIQLRDVAEDIVVV